MHLPIQCFWHLLNCSACLLNTKSELPANDRGMRMVRSACRCTYWRRSRHQLFKCLCLGMTKCLIVNIWEVITAMEYAKFTVVLKWLISYILASICQSLMCTFWQAFSHSRLSSSYLKNISQTHCLCSSSKPYLWTWVGDQNGNPLVLCKNMRFNPWESRQMEILFVIIE